MSAFPASALMTPEEAEREADGSELARTTPGDTLILVPLVFDLNGDLHSARSFNARLDSIVQTQSFGDSQARRTGSPDDDVQIFFTDLDTFLDVTQGESARRSSTSYASLYADGRRQSLSTLNGDAADGARRRVRTIVEGYDPYVCGGEVECPPGGDTGPGGSAGGGPGGCGDDGCGGARQGISDVKDRSPTPNWPELWVGDVVTGESTAFSPSNVSKHGHAYVITRVIDDARKGWRDV